MIDDTTQRLCSKCGQIKPTTDFYQRPSGTRSIPDRQCKECVKAYRRKRSKENGRRNLRSATSGRPTEQHVIDKLNSLGMLATSGKVSAYRWCDVVVWGCVKVEVKTALYNRGFSFMFTPTQVKRGIQTDFVLLVCNTLGEATTYHLFPRDFPAFYHTDHRRYPNGKLKHAPTYIPDNMTKRRSTSINVFTDEVMLRYKDAWWQIEQKRLEIIEQLKRGEFQP